MEIRQLEYFLMVNETHSFTRAAERLYVSQPAVTSAIRSLEEELEIQLFDRTQKQITLTSEGQIFLRHVQKVMEGISNTLNEIDALKSPNGGTLKIGLTPLAGVSATTSLLKEFTSQYPQIKLVFTESHSNLLEQELLIDAIDVAILFSAQNNNALTYLPLPREELYVICSRQHHLRRNNSVQLTDLVNESLILLAADCFYRQQIIQTFEKSNTLPQINFELNHIESIKRFVASNLGITILPGSLCDTDTDLVTIPLDPPLYRQPALAYKTNRHNSRAANAFIELLQKGGSTDE